jgi:pSer/pThr/pTyr-binding forkhead associated (FHA) protein
MADNPDLSKKRPSADWFLRGALTRLGDSFDRLTGRKWAPSSSLAASELIERINKLLDAESTDVPGKGTVVPHHIQLKMEWNKFSEDVEGSLKDLEAELTAAAVDHINDSLYYTYAPVRLEIKPDYFVEGVKLYASFDDLDKEKRDDVELNVTVPAINLRDAEIPKEAAVANSATYLAKFALKGVDKETRLEFGAKRQCSVGRSGGNDLFLDDASVSKIHGSLSMDNGQLVVADTGSTNGTFVNDQRIAYGKATALVETDKVRFGQVEVSFRKEAEPAAQNKPDALVDQPAKNETVEIDGFEFQSKRTTDAAIEGTELPPVSAGTREAVDTDQSQKK